MEFLDDWGISIAVFAPVVAAAIMMIMPKKNEAAHKWLALGASLVSVGFGIAMLANFITPPGAFGFKTAFDERFARFSPGVLLQLENLDLLDRPQVEWCDSCAAPDHPMIDGLWSGRRPIGRVSIAIGGAARRAVFGRLVNLELARHPVAA